uniref:Milk fat globule EGF and factor V/VIII domain containing n=1 Tax=Phocoena sinus TaxID=42100 RepID=A0A8C9BJB3_PHOSS
MPCPRVLAALCGALLCASGLFAFSGDFCDSSQCLHGGTCLLDQDRKPPFHCLCPEGFTGLICNETERGPCFPNPCHSDAECQVIDDFHRGDVFTQYICKCPHGYTGIHCEIVCTSPLGMETGAIADSQISASSMHLGFMGLQRWAPYLARLHLTGIVNAWTSSNYDRSPWIQVNLMRKMRVTGVVTQGASRAGSAEYLKTFKVAYSTNGRKFQFIQGAGESGDKIFMGNVDNSGLKVNLFETPLEVQYVRLVPMICHRGCTLRFELLGCELNGCAEPLGLKDNTIPSKQITASSFYKTWGLSAFSWYPFYARLDNQGKFNAWTAQTNSASEWLQFAPAPSLPRRLGAATCGTPWACRRWACCSRCAASRACPSTTASTTPIVPTAGTRARATAKVWSSLTSTPKGATSSTSTRPSGPARNRTRWWPPLSSCSGPGRKAWTGATQAGCRTPLCSTPSRRPDTPAVAWAWHLACAAMAHATAACTAMMCSALLLPSGVSGMAEHRPAGGRAVSEELSDLSAHPAGTFTWRSGAPAHVEAMSS